MTEQRRVLGMKSTRYAPLLFWVVLATVAPLQAHPASDNLIRSAHEKKLADHPYWRRLLHVRIGWFGRTLSDIDGKNFFLSPQGRTNPRAELDATLRAFLEPISTDAEVQHPQCRFPERYYWLKGQLNFSPVEVPDVSCDRFGSWRDKLKPQGVSLVFASYYMNNPASMYGHTFLRLNRKGQQDEAHLLDYTINFSANTGTTNGLLFALFGLTGGFRGVFATEPYYMKVQKYNNLESRDLWEYTLDIDQAGLDRMVRHLWELGQTWSSYYFLNKNCSYQLLPLLEVARPDLNLSELFTVRTIPLDTLRVVLEQPGLVTETKFRPSHLRKMRNARAALTNTEAKLAEDFTLRPETNPEDRLGPMSGQDQAKVLDAAYDFLRYKSGFYREQSQSVQATEQKILNLRNQRPTGHSLSEIARPDAPESAHGSGRIAVGGGLTRGSSFEEISYRGSLHDLEADPRGFTEGSELEMFHFRARYNNTRGKFYLHQGTLVNVKSLTPWEPWVKPPSWGIKIGFDSARDLNRDPENSLYFGVGGRSGLTLRVPGVERLLWYGLLEMDSGVGGIFRKHFRLGAGGSSGFLFRPGTLWRLHGSVKYLRYGAGNVGSANIVQLTQAVSLHKNMELRLSAERQNHHQELLLQLLEMF